MLQSLLLYTKQRFSPVKFPLLALFLLLHAVGQTAMHLQHIYLFVLLLAILYLFRLFDDLASREVDAAKTNRIYTLDAPYRQLLRFCLGYALVLLLLLGMYHLQAGLLLLGFLLLNAAAYYVLFHKGQWRFVLPLLKYPFLCFLMLYMASAPATIASAQALSCLSLLPVFLLFESLSDPEFRLSLFQVVLLFVAAHLLLWFAYPAWGIYLPVVALAVLFLLWRHLKRTAAIPYAPYLLLLYFLMVRLISSGYSSSLTLMDERQSPLEKGAGGLTGKAEEIKADKLEREQFPETATFTCSIFQSPYPLRQGGLDYYSSDSVFSNFRKL